MKKEENHYIIKWVKKIRAINLLGGKCSECGEDRPWVLCFHHTNPEEKEYNINVINHTRWSQIEPEIKKCILLCHNCHRKIHKKPKNVFDEYKKIKLDFLNFDGCKICRNADPILAMFDFHHEKEKLYRIDKVYITKNSCDEVKAKVENELNKCIVLCANCHADLHFDKEKFEKYKEIIYNYDYKELQKPVNADLVFEMLASGKRQIDIARELGYAKSTICELIKRNKK